jgi:hypothetical protein
MIKPIAALLFFSSAVADQRAAEDCILAKVWDGYADGYGVRSVTSAELDVGETKTYAITLYAGNEYRLRTCGDRGATDIDLALYDAHGTLLLTDRNDESRQPELSFVPKRTQAFNLVVRLADARRDTAGVALAVSYRGEDKLPEPVASR